MSILLSLIKDLITRKPANRPADAVAPPDEPAHEQKRFDEGVAHFQNILHGNPNDDSALYNLGLMYEMQGKEDEALASYRQAAAVNASHYAARLGILHLMQRRCEWGDWSAEIGTLRTVVSQSGRLTQANVLAPFSFLLLPGTTAQEQMRCAERLARVEMWRTGLDAYRKQLGFDFKRPPNDKVRVGYLSADFRRHAVATQIAEIFELHDRSRFRTYGYSFGPDDRSAMRARIARSFDEFTDVRNESLEETAKRIYRDGIDILVDLTGHTVYSRSGILALRPAPVQVNFLGYPGTLGADCVDHILADAFIVPATMRQYYTENVVCLPDCYMPSDRTRARPPAPSRAESGLPEKGFVFCCINQPFKITPAFFDVWCRLLNAVPGSVLWLSARNPVAAENLKQEAAKRGIDPSRLVMAPSNLTDEAHVARLQCADLFLDTSPYNAHATCSDALWMGLPVITCSGDTFPSRVAGSMLTTLGTPELVTYNLDDYYRLALELANDAQRHDVIRRKIISNRETSPLFDSTRFTRNLEQCYMDMLQRQQRGNKAAPQPVQPR